MEGTLWLRACFDSASQKHHQDSTLVICSHPSQSEGDERRGQELACDAGRQASLQERRCQAAPRSCGRRCAATRDELHVSEAARQREVFAFGTIRPLVWGSNVVHR